MIQDKIAQDLVTAMKTKDAVALTGLRGLKTTIANDRIEKGRDLTEDEVITLVQKEIKKRREVAEIYKNQSRTDLLEIEEAEIKLFEKYLPEQLSPEEVRPILEAIIKEVGATSVRDMGKVMGLATKQLGGKTDSKTIGELVKAILA